MGRARERTVDDVVAGRRTVLELLRSGGGVERVLISEELAPAKILGNIRKLAGDCGVPVRNVPRREVDRLAGGVNHQGVVALAGRFRYAPLAGMLAVENPAVLFLDGVLDPHNLGSLLRSADGAGFSGVVIPARRSVSVTAAVRRVSAGASEVVPVARETNLGRALDEAKKAGLWILGLEGTATTSIWSSDLLVPPVGLVLGAEDKGISPSIRDRCDGMVHIPSSGQLESLNVAVAGAIAMFEVARRRDLDTL